MEEGSFKEIGDELKSWIDPFEKIMKSLDDMYLQSYKINENFVAGRVRLEEMRLAIANSAAGVIRLGGQIGDVSDTIIGIAEGSRRNVIATEEQVSKLYAANKVLGLGASDLVEKFGEVGYETSQIGVNLEESIEYIQSVGLNAKKVMGDVRDNMSQMNRFQFEGGVAGLAKMAAQASMLRFNMSETIRLADKVLNPEGAIETASAFQRLGVNIGNLADPFALMNASINDPSGLQTSLAEVAKQFTYFDEETKSFKINPQGVLTLKAMEDQTGVSAAEMSKMGLAAAELDKRLSDVNMAGLKFENEEDKQYLANISKMGKGGKYEVELKDGTTKELQNLNQEEFDELIEQQRNAPKTLEDIQQSQLETLQQMLAEMRGAGAKATFGVASSKNIRSTLSGAENIARALSTSVNQEMPESRKIAAKLDNAIDSIRDLYVSKDSGKISNEEFTKKVELIENNIKKEALAFKDKGVDALKNILQETSKKVTGDSAIEKQFREFAKETSDAIKITSTKSKVDSAKESTQKTEPISYQRFFGKQNTDKTETPTTKTKSVNSQIDVGGTITIKVDAPAGVSQQQLTTYFESPAFKEMIYKYYEDKSKELEKNK